MRINYYISNMKGKITHSIERVDFKSKKVTEREEVRSFGDLRQVKKVGKLHKAKRQVKIDSKRENLEGQFMYLANKEKKREERASAQRSKRQMYAEKRKAKRA